MKIKNKFLLSFGFTLVIFLFSFVLGAHKVSAATLTLSGSCSIDAAITNANNNDQSGSTNCTAGSGADTIVVPSGTWSIGVDNDITDNLTITGSGPEASIIDGASTYKGLNCDGTNGGPFQLNISNIKIQNTGNGLEIIGGMDCNLSVSDTDITGFSNYAGIHFVNNYTNAGDLLLSVDNVYIHDGSGGGVMGFMQLGSTGTLSLNANINRLTTANLTPFNNNGIGVSFTGFADTTGVSTTVNAVIRNSTITGAIAGILTNASSSNGGTGNVTVLSQNNTVIGNSNSSYPVAGIGGFAAAGSGSNSTSIINVQNTLLINNSASNVKTNCGILMGSQGGTESSTINSLGHNITDDSTCNFSVAGDLQNQSNVQTLLGSLQNNGGFTPTIALLEGNPAVDGGATIGAITTDQRGISRPQGTAYDVGAYESSFSKSQNGTSTSGGSAVVPKVPDTGFRLLMNNPAFILIVSFICMIVILVLARKYKTKH